MVVERSRASVVAAQGAQTNQRRLGQDRPIDHHLARLGGDRGLSASLAAVPPDLRASGERPAMRRRRHKAGSFPATRQPSDRAFGLSRVSGRLKPGLGKDRRLSCRNSEFPAAVGLETQSGPCSRPMSTCFLVGFNAGAKS
jgi:hypothetical protein